jgi:hypothetical protein
MPRQIKSSSLLPSISYLNGEHMMFSASSLTREQFVSWIGGSYKPAQKRVEVPELTNMVRHGDICLIWKNDGIEYTGDLTHPLIAIPDHQVRDFFSFVSTYIGTYQPFSAFFRVVKISMLLDLLFERPTIPDRLGEKLVGAIIAETRLQLGTPRKDISDISIQACVASLSFAAVAGLRSGAVNGHFESVLENWTKTRVILTDEPLAVPSATITKFWHILQSAIDPSHRNVQGKHEKVVELVSQIFNSSDESEPLVWHHLTDRLPNSRSAFFRLRDSREERIRAMDVISDELSSTRLDTELAEVLLGYAASKVAGGSLRYFAILEAIEQRFPLATMWFGVFCSMRTDSDALVIAECLGRRVLRHFNQSRNLFAPPTADISFDEFANMMAVAKPPRWRTEHSNSISIEIFPNINSVFRFGPRPQHREVSSSEPTVSVEALHQIRSHTLQLLKILDGINLPVQGRLFPENSRRPPLFKKPKRT